MTIVNCIILLLIEPSKLQELVFEPLICFFLYTIKYIQTNQPVNGFEAGGSIQNYIPDGENWRKGTKLGTV